MRQGEVRHTSAEELLLMVEHMTMQFGGLVAIDDLSFAAKKREITAIIGPNGAGKTTVFNCLTGFYKPTVGRLTLYHPQGPFLLEQMEGFRIAQRAGVARTFQNIRLFAKMTVLENLRLGAYNRKARGKVEDNLNYVFALFPRLEERNDQIASTINITIKILYLTIR